MLVAWNPPSRRVLQLPPSLPTKRIAVFFLFHTLYSSTTYVLGSVDATAEAATKNNSSNGANLGFEQELWPAADIRTSYHDSESFSITSFLAKTREHSSHRFLSGSMVSL